MPAVQDWQRNRQMWIRILEKQTGESLEAWNRRLARQRLRDESSLRAWLSRQGVKGYAQSLLVMEQFGYPDFILATADQLIEQQYADRRELLPIYNVIIEAASAAGEVTIQARKTYVSLLTPRRTFARVQPTTKTRLDLGLRLESVKAAAACNHRRFTRQCDFRSASPHPTRWILKSQAGCAKRTRRIPDPRYRYWPGADKWANQSTISASSRSSGKPA